MAYRKEPRFSRVELGDLHGRYRLSQGNKIESSVKVLYDYDQNENMRPIRLPGLYIVGAEDGGVRES